MTELRRQSIKRYRALHRDKVRLWARNRYKRYAEKFRQKARERLAKNHDERRRKQRIQKTQKRLELRLHLSRIKGETGCKWCGEHNPICLDFHHTNGQKVAEISLIARDKTKLLEKELTKCIVLCANCHRKQHSLNNPRFRKWNNV